MKTIKLRILRTCRVFGTLAWMFQAATGFAWELALIDTNFNIGAGVSGAYVHALAVRVDGAVLIGGNFTRVQGAARSHFAQIARDGTIDGAFAPTPGANGEVLAVAYQADGKALVGGCFTRVNNTNRSHIARLDLTGAVDFTFDPGTGTDGEVRSLAVQQDGKVVLGGTFTRCRGVARAGVARLNADGSLDPAFNPGSGVGGERFVDELIALSNGKIIVAGDFPSYNGVKCGSIVRLNPDGSLDPEFHAGAGAKPGDPILGTALQSDGKILIVGSFTGFNGKNLRNVARLNEDGSLDTTFIPGAGTAGGPVNGLLHSVAVEPDGKILIGGWFDRLDNQPRWNVARLLPWGKADTNWCPRIDAQVRALKLDFQHNILVAGDFTRVTGQSRSKVAKLGVSGPIPASLRSCNCSAQPAPHFSLVGDPVRTYELQVSTDLRQWQHWLTAECRSGSAHLADPDAARYDRRFYRAMLVE